LALFSKSKEQIQAANQSANQSANQNVGQLAQGATVNSGGVPATLPDTVVDKLNLGVQIALDGAGGNLQEVYTQKQKPNDDHKRIPPEIVHENRAMPSRMPLQETKYVSISPNPAAIRENETGREQGFERGLDYDSSWEIGKIKGMNAEQFNSISFFSQMEKFFTSGSAGNSFTSYSSSDLLGKMKEYHSSIKSGNSFFLHDGHAQEQIYRKVGELKELETEWFVRKSEIESMEHVLFEKEAQIELKFEELKKLMSSAEKYRLFNMRCPEENCFVLNNGKRLFSVQELLDYLPQMPDSIFSHHVSGSRNDFSLWIKYVFGSESLSEYFLKFNSKEELIKGLKLF
jgi:hypothetical protein